MRVYLAGTSSLLGDLAGTGSLGPEPLTAFAVTPGLREWYVDDDTEELEYAASMEAARASLRLLAADPSAARRRVVVAADVPDSAVTVRDDLDRGVVRVIDVVRRESIASVHVDGAEAEPTVAVAAEAILAADLGDEAAQEQVDDAEGYELEWYGTQEIENVLGSL